MNEREQARPIAELYDYWCNDIEPIKSDYRQRLNNLLDGLEDSAGDIIMDYSEEQRRRCFFGGFRMALAILQEGYS